MMPTPPTPIASSLGGRQSGPRVWIVGVTFLVSLIPAGAGGAQESPLVIRDVRVLDGVSDRPLENVTVVVRNGRISTVGAFEANRLPADADVIDGRRHTLLPGLWDMHTHLSYWGEDALELLLRAGATSIREMGGDPDEIEGWISEIEQGERSGPEMIWCGPFLEGPEGGADYRLTVATPAQAREAVHTLARRGVDFLKIQPAIDPEVVRALIDEGRTMGLPVVGHIPNGVGPAEASEMGLRSIEHMVGAYLRMSDQELDALFATFRRNGTWISPALYSMVAPIEARGEDPSAVAEVDRAREVLRRAHEAGVPILVGSNFAYRDWPQQPGSGLHGEIRALVEAGIPPIDVINLSTSRAAEFAGVADRVGRVEPGMQADLVLVEGNPLEDIRRTEEVALVVKKGRIVHRSPGA